jgi:trans-aconitate 2-methyltransferase
MLDEAARRLARFGDRVTYVEADLEQPLPLDEPVDAVFSTATFHWINDHDALFANLAAVMRPDAELIAQCGGPGNIENVRQAVLSVAGSDADGGWRNFATPEQTAARLESTGFVDIRCWTHEEPTEFESWDACHEFLRTVILRVHLAKIDENERQPFVEAVAAEMGRPFIGYVRLNIEARRPGPTA